MMRIIVGMSGASGSLYAIRLLETLGKMPEVETHLIMTPSAKLNVRIETDYSVERVSRLADEVHGIRNVAASIASGSFKTAGMIVVPCSMKTLSGIVHSYSDDLLRRAADVVLKERRRLVLVPRETPLHSGHCKLLYEASQLGAIIAPPMPALYNRPATIEDMIDHTVGRLLDLFGLDVGTLKRWEGLPNDKMESA
jgi:4-hydroxy-3-polyprenylbenzoate decarboxylase